MNRCFPSSLFAALLCATLPVVASGQSETRAAAQADRPFALVVDSKLVSVNGTRTNNRHSFEEFPKTHAGSYLVFEDQGTLYVDKDPAAVTELERLYAPMRPLNAQQSALHDRMKPLEQRMKLLAGSMRASQSAQEQTQMGATMRDLGEQMERTGKEQGAVGERQGRIGRAFYDRAQAVLMHCLANGSCRPA